MKKLFVLFVFGLFSVGAMNAQALYFHLSNNTGKTFAKIYVSPAESGSWGYNLIPRSYLYDEYETTIYLPSSYGRTCYFDIKIIATDGTWYKFSDLNICDLYRLTVNWNSTYNTQWSRY